MENKVTLTHSETVSLPDGTELKITIENYENKIFPMGDEVKCKVTIGYTKIKGVRYIQFYKNPLSQEEMENDARIIIDKIKKDPNNYRWQHAPK